MVASGIPTATSAEIRPVMALDLNEVSCSYGGTKAVRSVSFSIPKGAYVALIGPNGAGKTTLLNCISGYNSNYRGRVLFDGHDISRKPLHHVANQSLARTFQVPRIYRRMTVVSNVMLGARRQIGESVLGAVLGTWRKQEAENLERAWALLTRFGLERVADNYGAELSGGQERLVELCRILMLKPRAILLDEPFAGVSPANRRRLADLILELKSDPDFTILMVEHRLEWVDQLCERTIVLANGAVIADGTLAELRGQKSVIDSYLGSTEIA